ncbi:MAG TPA: hypothetical protein VKG65_03485 [Terriglobales bacterium]|nr:hypothetical protein [Terriglobales bacterium]
MIVAGEQREASGPHILATRSSFYRGTEGVMGWDISEEGFKIVLSAQPRQREQSPSIVFHYHSELRPLH